MKEPDSVPLDWAPARARLQMSNIKMLFSLFIIFLIVVSDVFTNSVLSAFGSKAVQGREPTTWGVVLQGIFLVIGYILMIYLTEQGIF